MSKLARAAVAVPLAVTVALGLALALALGTCASTVPTSYRYLRLDVLETRVSGARATVGKLSFPSLLVAPRAVNGSGILGGGLLTAGPFVDDPAAFFTAAAAVPASLVADFGVAHAFTSYALARAPLAETAGDPVSWSLFGRSETDGAVGWTLLDTRVSYPLLSSTPSARITPTLTMGPCAATVNVTRCAACVLGSPTVCARCVPGWSMPSVGCSVSVASCSAASCANGGVCVALPYGKFACRCSAPFSGATCASVTMPANPSCEAAPCVAPHGRCELVLTATATYAHKCVCVTGRRGADCSLADTTAPTVVAVQPVQPGSLVATLVFSEPVVLSPNAATRAPGDESAMITIARTANGRPVARLEAARALAAPTSANASVLELSTGLVVDAALDGSLYSQSALTVTLPDGLVRDEAGNALTSNSFALAMSGFDCLTPFTVANGAFSCSGSGGQSSALRCWLLCESGYTPSSELPIQCAGGVWAALPAFAGALPHCNLVAAPTITALAITTGNFIDATPWTVALIGQQVTITGTGLGLSAADLLGISLGEQLACAPLVRHSATSAVCTLDIAEPLVDTLRVTTRRYGTVDTGVFLAYYAGRTATIANWKTELVALIVANNPTSATLYIGPGVDTSECKGPASAELFPAHSLPRVTVLGSVNPTISGHTRVGCQTPYDDTALITSPYTFFRMRFGMDTVGEGYDAGSGKPFTWPWSTMFTINSPGVEFRYSEIAYAGFVNALQMPIHVVLAAPTLNAAFVMDHCRMAGLFMTKDASSVGIKFSAHLSNITISNSVFDYIETGGFGGAIHLQTPGSNVRIVNNVFQDMSAVDSGGGLYILLPSTVEPGAITVSGNKFIACGARRGGSIFIQASSTTGTFRLDANIMSDGKTLDSGGAVSVSARASNVLFELVDLSITSCLSTSGGGVYFESDTLSATLSIIRGSFVRASATFGGAVYIQSLARARLLDSLVFSPGIGVLGGIFVANQAHLLIERTRMLNGFSVQDGAAIHVDCQGEVVINDCVFADSFAMADGGAISLLRGVATVRNSTFSRISAAGRGGAIAVLEGVLTIIDSRFEDNTATAQGGDIIVHGNAYATITRVNSTRAAARGAGGSIFSDPMATVVITDSNFALAKAPIGGALALTRARLTRVTVDGASANRGAGLFVKDVADAVFTLPDYVQTSASLCAFPAHPAAAEPTVTVVDSTFRANSAATTERVAKIDGETGKTGGGAIWLGSASVASVLTRVTFDSNSASFGGDVFVPKDAQPVELDAMRSDGSAAAFGGSIYVASGGTVRVSASAITGATATHNGGAIYLARDARANLTDVTIADARAPSPTGLGGCAFVRGLLVMDNVLCSRTSAAYGGGLFVAAAGVVVAPAAGRGAQISSCSARRAGGGLATEGYASSMLVAPNDLAPLVVTDNVAEHGGGGALFVCVLECDLPLAAVPTGLGITTDLATTSKSGLDLTASNRGQYGAKIGSSVVAISLVESLAAESVVGEVLTSSSGSAVRLNATDLFGQIAETRADESDTRISTVSVEVAERKQNVALVGSLSQPLAESGQVSFGDLVARIPWDWLYRVPSLTLQFTLKVRTRTDNEVTVTVNATTRVANCTAGTSLRPRASTQFVSCVACDPGRFAAVAAAESCEDCPTGTHAPAARASACLPCPAGSFASLRGVAECSVCAPGEFSEAGAARCLDCPAGSRCESGELSAKDGWWIDPSALDRHPSISAAATAGDYLFRCPSHAACVGGLCAPHHFGPVCDRCVRSDGNSTDVYARVGLTCSKCPARSVSFVLMAIGALAILGVLGYFVASATTAKSELSIVFKRIVDYCQMMSLTIEFSSQASSTLRRLFNFTQTATASIDVFPVACVWDAGYYSMLRVHVVLPPLAVGIVAGVVFAMYIRANARARARARAGGAGQGPRVGAEFQLSCESASEAEVSEAAARARCRAGEASPARGAASQSEQQSSDDAPVPFGASADSSSSAHSSACSANALEAIAHENQQLAANFMLTAVETCAVEAAGLREVIVAAADEARVPRPAALTALQGSDDDSIRKKHIGLFISTVSVIYFLAYPTVVKTLLAAFPCHPGLAVLKADVSLVCGTREHTGYRLIAALTLALYAVVVPAATFVYLRRYAWQARELTALTLAEQLPVLPQEVPELRRFLFLIDGYRPFAIYWELVLVLRKTAIAIVLVFFADDPTNQAVLGLMVVFVFALAHMYNKPFLSRAVNVIEAGSLVCVMLSLLGSVLYVSDSTVAARSATMTPTAAWVLIVLNVSFLVAVMVYVVRAVLASMRKREATIAPVTAIELTQALGGEVLPDASGRLDERNGVRARSAYAKAKANANANADADADADATVSASASASTKANVTRGARARQRSDSSSSELALSKVTSGAALGSNAAIRTGW